MQTGPSESVTGWSCCDPDMTLLQLIRLIVQKNIRAEKFLSVLSIIGVALGIGLFIGVKVASDRALQSFEADIRGLNPYANYEILDNSGIDFHESVYKKVREVNENSFPVLEVKGYVPAIKETIDLKGIDTVRAVRFLKLRAGIRAGFADYFRELHGVAVTKVFAEGHSLKIGDSLRAHVYDGEFELKIVDIIDIPLLAPNTLLMDIGNYQEYFGKSGYLSRIDLDIGSAMDPAMDSAIEPAAAEKVREVIPPSLSLEKKIQLIKEQQSLLRSFRYNLQFVSLIAILVGIFLLYNTIFISTVKRRTEIGILRGLGIGKGTVVLLFVIHGLFLGLIGSVLGILFGQAVAWFAVGAVEKTITSMYGTISISGHILSAGDMLLAIALGLFVSFVASAVPALEAAGTRPNESSREGTGETKQQRRRLYYPLIGALLVVLGCTVAYIDYRGMPFDFPFLSYAGILFILLGFTVLAPSYLSLLLAVFKKPLGRLFGPGGIIALGDMQGNIYRFSVALMSVAVSSALIISLFTLIYSFRSSLMVWIQKNISADVYIKPAACRANFCYFPLSDGLVNIVETFPGVAFLDRFRTLQIDFRGRKIVAGFGERDELLRNSYQTGQTRQIGVSSYLGTKYGLKTGDSFEIPTPAGRVPFIISNIFSSYSTASGFVYLDRKWLNEYWGLDDATQLALYLDKGVDINRFIKKLGDVVQPHYSVEIMNNGELRARVLAIFDRTFAITYAVELISIIVSLMGVINTLLALVLERKREFSIIRYLGADWRLLRGMLVLSAGIVGTAGIVLGAVIGPAMSIIFIEVVNKISFGWEIHFRLPVLYISFLCLGLFLTTLVAGLIPMHVARKIDPKRFISFE
ncbi:MAG: FtsX-like permease family protein [Thermodesulfovibrionales bacterium]